MLYMYVVVTHVSCLTKKTFFSVFQRYLPDSLGVNLFNAYYPVIISGFSVIICFWAEVSLVYFDLCTINIPFEAKSV